ncbi:hypothetical protein [Bradyrhizobium sp. CCBAU 11445]|uniref:hypothetical protein n=1 Tax=Bradyrhizobium sp. CCBAU 11445 TaxID=1630896 RepID=UPI0023051759|nr:hypothetical protein [Bradyrhizobium sp. CCBAU 11445]
MSAQIRRERNEYYGMLERTQKGNLDITDWLTWFLDCLDRAFDGADIILGGILRKADFWAVHERQRLVLNRLFDGFEGNLRRRNGRNLRKTPGYRREGHRRTHRPRHPQEGRCWRPEYKLLAYRFENLIWK